MNATSDLWDWRRRIADLYARIRSSLDPAAAWQEWRETRDAMFARHPQTPLNRQDRTSFAALPYFPYDPSLRLTAALRDAPGAHPFDCPGGRDGAITMQAFAVTDGLAERLGGELTLYWLSGYGGGTFLPYTDATTGSETYPGGRYLLDTIKGADLGRTAEGHIVLDFNFSYNPSCAYSPEWLCPLAPEANRLPVPVRAGERMLPP
jgi:uncharacterized protein (DUF1684 family)